MADRAVFSTRKDIDGDIIALGNPDASWSPRSKHDAIVDISLGLHTYHVPLPTGRAEVRVVVGTRGKYLQAEGEGADRNGLEDLPDL